VSYRWAIAGIVFDPVAVLTEDQLIGRPTRYEIDEGVRHFHMDVEREVYPFRDGLVLRRATMLVQRLKGPSRGIACFNEHGDRMGFVFEKLAFVHPVLRGRGLGAELMAENYMAEPEILRARARSVQRLSWSVAGEAAARAAYRLMLERGGIVAPPGRVGVGSAHA